MPDHIQINFPGLQPEQQEILVAQLAELGFESFEETESELSAFISAPEFDETLLRSVAYKYQIEYNIRLIPERNWNAVWESQFTPVVIGNFVAVRADFHPPVGSVEHEIVITPKMSFGTGHHATTRMMLRRMASVTFAGKTVLDLGTGTGILSILAEKLGAAAVIAVDIDPWSITNAEENLQKNGCAVVKVSNAGNWGNEFYDVVLANINRNVILQNLGTISSRLRRSGLLLISGILLADLEEFTAEADRFQLKLLDRDEEEGWLCAAFEKTVE